MPRVKGQKEYERFKEGEKLTYREMILAMCYRCAGAIVRECDNLDCPLILSKSPRAYAISPEARKKVGERLKRGRGDKNL